MMKITLRKTAIALVLAAVLILGALFIHAGLSVQPSSDPDVLSSTKLSTLPDGVKTASHSGVYSEYSFSEVSYRSTLIAYGKVGEICPPVVLRDVFGGTSVYTDILFQPETVFRGEADAPITVRLPGGLADGLYHVYTEIPEFRLNEKYLLFLYQPGMGNGLYEKGDFYYLAGDYQGAFSPADDKQRKALASQNFSAKEGSVFVNSLSPSDVLTPVLTEKELSSETLKAQDVALSLEALPQLFETYNAENPVDPALYRREIVDTYQSNLASGFISQEEYETYMASLDQYAVALTDEEQDELTGANSAEKEALLGQANAGAGESS